MTAILADSSVQRLCLRQNAIYEIEGLSALAPSLQELDLYDNLIRHIHGLEELTKLTSLDLSFNNIKTIKRIDHLRDLKDVYFVQNKIQKIEGLEGLTKLRNLELAANRLRVLCHVSSQLHRSLTCYRRLRIWKAWKPSRSSGLERTKSLRSK